MWSNSKLSSRGVLFVIAFNFLWGCGGNPEAPTGDDDDVSLGGRSAGGTSGSSSMPPDVNLGGAPDGDDAGAGGGKNGPCQVDDPPPECFESTPSGPACGDGEINVDGEECDDGNSLPGDGCSGICGEEPYFKCTDPGMPCVLTIQCGDGILDPGEFCDDGNTDDGDGCSADCTEQDTKYVCRTPGEPCTLLYDCGDSRVNGEETCDDGNRDSGDGCSDTCEIEDGYLCRQPGMSCIVDEYCGDGIIQAPLGENCDDGNAEAGDGCSSICTQDPFYECDEPGKPCVNTLECGNGKLEPGENCDDGNTDGADGCSADCTEQDASYVCPTPGEKCQRLYACGDKRINGSDECDDGNTGSGDGCSADCKKEEGYRCVRPGQPCVRVYVCGDGVKNGTEECDDGNTVNGDGCSACSVDPYFTCPSAGGVCTSTIVCGDSRRDPGEQCDDGNRVANDGCNASCVKDPNYICPTVGRPCTRVVACGDGKVGSFGGTVEQCDDGNTASGDGCNAACQREDGFRCPTPNQPCVRIPRCGDATRQSGEACDDGNTTNADGCSGTCQVEQDWTCNTASPNRCTYGVRCGDGQVGTAEVCDDGNAANGDGCSSNCKAVEQGFDCTREGFACRPICGDGRTRAGEQCDDGNTTNGDGCNSRCQIEENTYCTGTAEQPSSCQDAVCGQGTGKQGTEPCDDGNNAWGDGCTPDCKKEPTCAVGTACTSACGDGILFPGEGCDDGNNTPGDGCSATCTVENGYVCDAGGTAGDTLLLPMIVRDFMAAPPFAPGTADTGITTGHGDFEFGGDFATDGGLYRDPDTTLTDNWTNSPTLPGAGDAFQNGRNGNIRRRDQRLFGVLYDFVTNTLSATKKPVFAYSGAATSFNDMGNCPLPWGALIRNNQGYCEWQVQNTASFNRWFSDVDAYNNTYRRALTLRKATGTENYVYDSNTHRADGTAYPTTGTGSGYKGFWPLDDVTGVARYSQCDINGQGTAPTHNFHFTSETHHWFRFDSSSLPTLIFTGDDDVFVYIGGRLALDLGGIHGRVQGTVALTAAGNATETHPDPASTATPPANLTAARTLGLTNGGVYEIVVFQAERNTCESNYRLELRNFNLSHSVCVPRCGDGVETPDEQCDDGDDNTPTATYNACTTQCKLGPYCGDGVRQTAQEACDNGTNTSGWGATGATACAPGCVLPPRCGDGILSSGFEECDDGDSGALPNNTATGYGGCTTSCQRGPYCGDGAVNGTEACDDGVNDGSYGTCGAGCTPAPRCGDGTVQAGAGEECDGAANCTSECRLKCGNRTVDAGEACDDGINAGGYNRCDRNCVRGPYCGDGTKNGPEECDLGTANNNGTYGGCNANCTLAPRCGDGIETTPPEACDDGVNDGSYGTCTPACAPGPRCGDGTVQSDWGEVCDAPSDPNCANCRPRGVCGDGHVDPQEECDDGKNAGGYGECAPGCHWSERCGDGVVQRPFEQCDEGATGNDGGYGECTERCQLGPYCGDGRIEPPETCDDGVNDERYESCTQTCEPGPRCGDEIVQEEWGEECDDDSDPNCSQCRLGAQCGDRVVQAGEQCDDGVNDGGWGECGPRCEYGPRCGDGVVQPAHEQCDDGEGNNTGEYGKCAPGCVYGPYCGDGRLQRAFEECDDGNNTNGDDCSAACKKEIVVPR